LASAPKSKAEDRARRDAIADALERKLGYRFKDPGLALRALTHASGKATPGKSPQRKATGLMSAVQTVVDKAGQLSPRAQKRAHANTLAGTADNERLEFIGDRVLGLVMAEFVSEAYPDAPEGELARRYNQLVQGPMCAEVARGIGLGSLLVLSESEAENGGREKETILADACEALLAALYLEAGFEKTRAIIRMLWSPRLDDLPEEAVDPKSALQEWAQGRGLPRPIYVELSREGPDHAPRFTSEVKIAGRRSAQGTGASKRAAEQAAALELLAIEGVRPRGLGSKAP
jgi:ribonuclease III